MISQQVLLIACPDKRSDTGQLAIIGTMLLSEIQTFQLHQILQGSHRTDTIPIELVHIDQSEKRKFLFTSAHTGNVELVNVEPTKFFRQQNVTESRLATPLC